MLNKIIKEHLNIILNEQEEDNVSPWTKEEMGIVKMLGKRDFDKNEPTTVIEYLKELGYDKDDAIDLYYIYKNNLDDEGNIDFSTPPNRDKGWDIYEPEQIALALFKEVDPSEVIDKEYDTYGMKEYEVDGEEYIIGSEDDANYAAYNVVKSYLEDGIYPNDNYLSDYIEMSNTDRHLWASDDTDNYINDLSDDEIIERGRIQDEIDEIDNEESENLDKISELESEVSDLESELEDLDANDDSERIEEINELVKDLESQIESLESIDYDGKKETLIDEIRETLREEYYDNVYDSLSDPIDYFINEMGIYSDVSELLKHGPVFIDEDKLARDMVSDDGVAHYLARYDGDENTQDYDDNTYFIYRTD
jgi:hypothetical protein